jgi:hypothetical protein
MGNKPGVQVVLDAICNDPICNYQPRPSINQARDAIIVAGILEGVPVVQIAFSAGMTRQRVYQIFDSWKRGN